MTATETHPLKPLLGEVEVRAALERVLGSSAFQRTPQLQRFHGQENGLGDGEIVCDVRDGSQNFEMGRCGAPFAFLLPCTCLRRASNKDTPAAWELPISLRLVYVS